MKKCLIYGNCQTAALKEILNLSPEFAAAYETTSLECFTLSHKDIPTLEKMVSEIDLFIHQPVSDNYKGIPQFSTRYLKSCLKQGSQAISFPVSYFTGYNPEMVYLEDKNGTVANGPFFLHDKNILTLYLQGKTVAGTIEVIQSEDFYPAHYLKRNVEITLAELARREVELDVKVSEFIQKNYQKARLFHTINHPGSIVMAVVAESVLDLIGIASERDALAHFYRIEVLDFNYFPIYPSVARGLELNFPCHSQYRCGNVFSIQETIELFFQFYDSQPELVKYNFLKLAGIPGEQIATDHDVDYCYRLLLGREPDPTGRNHWVKRVTSEAMSTGFLVAVFLKSEEFQSKYHDDQFNPRIAKEAAEQYVTYCYRLLLGQEVQVADRNRWIKRIGNEKMSTKELISEFLTPEQIEIINSVAYSPTKTR